MTEKSFMTVEEVAAELRVSKSKAYQIVRELKAINRFVVSYIIKYVVYLTYQTR